MLDKHMCSWKGKKNRASFQHKNPCNLQAMMLKPLDFPRENSRIFEMKVNSFALAKTTFFKNAQNAGAVFPPTGSFCWKSWWQEVSSGGFVYSELILSRLCLKAYTNIVVPMYNQGDFIQLPYQKIHFSNSSVIGVPSQKKQTDGCESLSVLANGIRGLKFSGWSTSWNMATIH